MALEQAATYLDTVPTVKQLGLNHEELRAYSVGLLEIREYPSQTTNAEATTTVSVPVAIVMDPTVVTHQLDSLMLNERAKNRN